MANLEVVDLCREYKSYRMKTPRVLAVQVSSEGGGGRGGYTKERGRAFKTLNYLDPIVIIISSSRKSSIII